MSGATSSVPKLQGRPSSVGDFSHRGQFEVVKELHKSTGGSVHLAHVKDPCVRARRQVILKRRKVAELGNAKDMLNEYEVLKQLNHPNIIGCYGYFWEFESQSVFIVLEYANRGDLHTELQVRRQIGEHFSDDEVWDIFAQVLLGLAHMHSKGIVHRDIKCLNLLLTDSGIVKVGDFGVSRIMSEQTQCLNSFYGTPLYLSPELVQGRPYDHATDVWSLGVVLYELLALEAPFKGSCLQDVISAVVRGRYSPLPKFRPSEFGALVDEMLTRESNRRPETAQLLRRLERLGRVRSGVGSSDQPCFGTSRGGGALVPVPALARPAREGAASPCERGSPLGALGAVAPAEVGAAAGQDADNIDAPRVVLGEARPRPAPEPPPVPMKEAVAAGRPTAVGGVSAVADEFRPPPRPGVPWYDQAGTSPAVEVIRVRRKSRTPSGSQRLEARDKAAVPPFIMEKGRCDRQAVLADPSEAMLVPASDAGGGSFGADGCSDGGPTRDDGGCATAGVQAKSSRDLRWEERRRANVVRVGRRESSVDGVVGGTCVAPAAVVASGPSAPVPASSAAPAAPVASSTHLGRPLSAPFGRNQGPEGCGLFRPFAAAPTSGAAAVPWAGAEAGSDRGGGMVHERAGGAASAEPATAAAAGGRPPYSGPASPPPAGVASLRSGSCGRTAQVGRQLTTSTAATAVAVRPRRAASEGCARQPVAAVAAEPRTPSRLRERQGRCGQEPDRRAPLRRAGAEGPARPPRYDIVSNRWITDGSVAGP